MTKFKKLISVLMMLSMVAVIFAGCSKKTEAEDKGNGTTNNGEAMTVATINGEHKISVGEVNLYLRQMEAQFEAYYGPDVWDQPVEEGKTVVDIVKENALSATENSNIIALIAKDKGVTLSEEEAKQAEDLATEFIGQLDEATAEKDGITLDLIKRVLENQSLAQALYEQDMADYEVNEEELNTLLAQNAEYQGYQENGYDYYAAQVRARHILFSTLDEAGQPLPEEKAAEVLAKAEEVLAKAKDGEDFATLATEYTEDPGSKETGGEYTFGRGQMVPEFEATAFSLKPGEISDLVKTTFGYHIIKLEENIEPTDEALQAIKDKEQAIVDAATEQLKQQEFDKKFEEWKKDYTLEINEDVWNAVEVRQSRNEVIEEEKTENSTEENTDETTEDNNAEESKSDDSKE